MGCIINKEVKEISNKELVNLKLENDNLEKIKIINLQKEINNFEKFEDPLYHMNIINKNKNNFFD